VGYKIYAQRWLEENGLRWPQQAFSVATVSVLIAAFSLTGMILKPEYKWLILGVSLIFFSWNLWRYWLVLPSVAIASAKNIIVKIPGMRRFFFV
jgi:hypothetical protein